MPAIVSGELMEADTESLKAFIEKKFFLPDGLFGDREIARVETFLTGFTESLGGDLRNALVVGERCAMDMGDWKLEGSLAWRKKTDDGSLVFVALASSEKKSKYLSAYVSALATLAQAMNDETSSPIRLELYDWMKGTLFGKGVSFEPPPDAKMLLKDIYQAAFEENYAKAIPLDVWSKEKKLEWTTYRSKTEGVWKFFKSHKLFEFESICGIDEKNFDVEFKAAVRQMEKLILFAKMPAENSADANAQKKGSTAKKGKASKSKEA